MVPMLMPKSKRCTRCKSHNKNCTIMGGMTWHRICDGCHMLKQACSFTEERAGSSKAGSAAHSVMSLLANQVGEIEMSSGIAMPVKGDKWKAVEIGSSPEGQPTKS